MVEIVNISASKFSIDGRELFKLYMPVYVNDQRVKIVNVYDSRFALVNSSSIANYRVNGVVHNTANALIAALNDVIYNKAAGSDLDSAQVEANRLAIESLQNNSSSSNHNHNSTYYTKNQVNALLENIEGFDGAVSGEVDGNQLILKDSDGNEMGRIDVSTLKAQGTSIAYENGVLKLSNSSGSKLSETNIEVGAILDINSDSDKTDKWVIGTDIVGINGGGAFIGLSKEATPTTDSDFHEFLIVK